MDLRLSLLIITLLCSSFGFSQNDGTFTMDVSSDTVLLGNTFTLTYSIENLEGEFVPPDLSDFRVVHGPNVSSQFSSINGVVSRRSSYTYYLLPIEEGVGTIGSAKVGYDNEWAELEPVLIIIMDNPFGHENNFGSPLMKSQKQMKGDTLTEKQKLLLQKLKKGKRKKI